MKRLALMICCLLALILFLSETYAQDAKVENDAIIKNFGTLSRRIDSLNRKIDSLTRKIDTHSSEKNTLNKQTDTLKKNPLKFGGMIFSDFVGINKDQPNGLIQTNFYFSWERPFDSQRYPTLIPLRNIVLIDLTFSKIENDLYQLPVRYVSEDSTKGYLNRLDLYQYANIKAISKLNLITFKVPNAFKAYIDIIGTFYRTAIKDSLKLSDGENVFSVALGINAKLKTEIDPITHLQAELSYCYFKPSLFSKTYQETGGPQYYEHHGQITQDIVNEDISGINIIDLILNYCGEKTKKYLRISFCGNYFGKKNSTPNIFSQFQVGVEFNLLSLFEGKIEKSGQE